MPLLNAADAAYLGESTVDRIYLGATKVCEFDPILSMFANGEQGWVYDFQDLSTLFQDSAGTTPAVVGQVIGLVRDKSGNGNHLSQATTAKKPILRQHVDGYYYLEFDGFDDRLQTAAAIDFTGTDKLTVAMSVRKLSSGRAVIAFLGNVNFNENGTFDIECNSGGVDDYGFLPRGTTLGQCYTTAAYPEPITNVVQCAFDIAQATNALEIQPRVNGVTPPIASRVSTMGTGNFGNYPLHLAGWPGSSLPFAGHYFRVMGIGRLLTADEKTAADTWADAPVGVI